jgi:hypothetical protein
MPIFFKNLEASTSWNPQGLSRPVMGLFYLSGSPFGFKDTDLQIALSARNVM